MNMILNTRARGIIGVRAEGQNAAEIFEELKRTVEAFKAEHKKELEGIDKKFADVVQTEKVERINNEITLLQNALNDCNAMIAALKVGGAGSGAESGPAQREHADAFNKWFRRAMDVQPDAIRKNVFQSVSFTEATDFWNQLALGLI